jgi:hypothetical protein
MKPNFRQADTRFDIGTITRVLEAIAKPEVAKGLPSDAPNAQPQGGWAKATGVPVVPFVAESDVGLSNLKSTGWRGERWKLDTSVQQWDADLPRFLLTQPTIGERVDTTVMLTVGGESVRVGLGRVTAMANGHIVDLEIQQADIAQVGIGRWSLSIWNDTRHGTDQSVYTGGGAVVGDTSRWKVTLGDYRLDRISIVLRVGTGIPDRSQTEQVGDHRVYKPEGIKYSDASKGHLIMSGRFRGPGGREIHLTGVLSSGDLQHLVQSKILHTGLGLAPEFPNTNEIGFFVSADVNY